jgi:hypothetical protein
MNDLNWKDDVRINMFILHREVRDQPELLMTYAKEWAGAKRDQAYLERRLKVTRATTSKAIRESVGKITVDAIKDHVESNTDVQEAEDLVIEATYKANLLWGAVEAIKGRKTQIGEAIELYKMGYFSADTPFPDRQYALEVDQDNINKNIAEEKEEYEQYMNSMKETGEVKPIRKLSK